MVAQAMMALKKALPLFLRRLLRKAWDNSYDAFARAYYRHYRKIPLAVPPQRLRIRSGWQKDIKDFLKIGKECADLVNAEALKQGRGLFSPGALLDFGCGCGRTIRWLSASPATVQGVDTDAEAILWCKKNLGFAEFSLNKPFEPLPFSDNTFDLIYSISVFTHISQKEEDFNLKELERILKPGGLLIATVHLDYALGCIIRKEVPVEGSITERLATAGALAKGGFLFEPYEPGGSYGLSFHTEGYIRDSWGKYFAVAGFNPDRWQGVAVLRKYSFDKEVKA